MATQQLRIDAQRTVENILDTARAMLAENPNTSTAEIAERAQVHRTTLQRYFPTREALIEQLVQRSLNAIEERIAAAGTEDGDAREGIRRATFAWMDEARHWRAARYAPLGSMPGPGSARLRKRMLALLERGQAAGAVRTDVPIHTLVYAWAGLTMSFNALMTDKAPSELADEIVTLLGPSNDS